MIQPHYKNIFNKYYQALANKNIKTGNLAISKASLMFNNSKSLVVW